ncbi:hypothetical protein C8Q77DRAFT_1082411, partial [Trametes polyzona]
MQAIEETLHKPTEEEQLEQQAKENAAIRIQKAWRKRMRRRYLGSDFLWKDLAVHARMKVRHHARSGTHVTQLALFVVLLLCASRSTETPRTKGGTRAATAGGGASSSLRGCRMETTCLRRAEAPIRTPQGNTSRPSIGWNSSTENTATGRTV